METKKLKSFNVYIDEENVSISEYLGKNESGEIQKSLIFKSPRSPYLPNMLAAIFDNILKSM